MALQNNPNAIPMPAREELVVVLLIEELKSRRFFNALAEMGLDNPYHRPHLDEVILGLVGLNDEKNETYDFFCRVMDEHAEKIDVKEETVVEQAAVVYNKLIEYRGKTKK